MAFLASWLPSGLTRCALVALGTLRGLAVLEIGLQTAGAWNRITTPPAPVVWSTGNRRVLCLGDSNTYGIYLKERAEAYPQQLESQWNALSHAARIEVLNFGYPGTNSSRLLRDLPRMLETLRTNLVLVLVGANDCWTVPVPVAGPRALWGRLLRLIQRSRVYQFIYMLRRTSHGSTP